MSNDDGITTLPDGSAIDWATKKRPARCPNGAEPGEREGMTPTQKLIVTQLNALTGILTIAINGEVLAGNFDAASDKLALEATRMASALPVGSATDNRLDVHLGLHRCTVVKHGDITLAVVLPLGHPSSKSLQRSIVRAFAKVGREVDGAPARPKPSAPATMTAW